MKKKIFIAAISIFTLLFAFILLDYQIEVNRLNALISNLPTELQQFPFLKEEIHEITYETNRIEIIGKIHRERDSFSKFKQFYLQESFNSWDIDVSISDHPVADGCFTITFRQ